MTKEEMLSLGIPTDKQKNFHDMYFRDVNQAARRMTRKPDSAAPDELKRAISAMLPLINNMENLKKIFSSVSYHCMKEYQAPKYIRCGDPVANSEEGADANASEVGAEESR